MLKQVLLEKFNLDIGFDFMPTNIDYSFAGRTRYPKQAGHWRSNVWAVDFYDGEEIGFSMNIGSKAECKKFIKEIRKYFNS